MVQKIYKGSDILIQLGLKDAEGNPYRINSLTSFIIRFFTTDPETYIESSYQNGEYVGILNEEDSDYVILNASEILSPQPYIKVQIAISLSACQLSLCIS